MDAVVVRLGDTRYAVPMTDLVEVGRAPALTRVPGAPPWVAGVANWRGRILAAVDLRGMLAPDAYAGGPPDRLAVLARDGVTVGLLVDRLDGTLPLPDVVADAPATLTGPAAELVAGTVTDADGPLGLLDAGAVVALRHRLPATA